MAESGDGPVLHAAIDVDMRAPSSCAASSRSGRPRGRRRAVLQRHRGQGVRLALRDYPRANGAYRDGRFELYGGSTSASRWRPQDTLVVPTIFDADHKGLGEIAEETRALAEKVRDGTITPPELGRRHVHGHQPRHVRLASFIAVINPPQAAILAVGALEPSPSCATARSSCRTRHEPHARLRPPDPLRRRPPSSSSASGRAWKRRFLSRSSAAGQRWRPGLPGPLNVAFGRCVGRA